MNSYAALYVKELKGMRLAAAALLVSTLAVVFLVVSATSDGGGEVSIVFLTLPYLCPPLLAGLLIHSVSAEWNGNTQHQLLALPVPHAAVLLTKVAAVLTVGLGVFVLNTAGVHYVHDRVLVSLTPMFPPLNEITAGRLWVITGSLFGSYALHLIGLACVAVAVRARVSRFQVLATVAVFLLGLWVSGRLQDAASVLLEPLLAAGGSWSDHVEEVYGNSLHRVAMGSLYAALGAWLFHRQADA